MNLPLERLKTAVQIQKEDKTLWFDDPNPREKELQDALEILHSSILVEHELFVHLYEKIDHKPVLPGPDRIFEEVTKDKTQPPAFYSGFIEGCTWMLKEANKK